MKWLLLGLSAALLSAAPVVAQTSSAEVAADPYEHLFDAMEATVDQDAAIDRMVAELRPHFAQVPQFAELESRHPGTIAALCQAVRPVMAASSKRVAAKYHSRMVTVLRDGLTVEEATQIADFYASPFGRRVIAANSANSRSGAAVRATIAEMQDPGTDVQASLESAGNAALENMNEADRNRLLRELAARPAMAKMPALMPRLAAVRSQMETEPFTAAEDEEFRTAIEAVVRPLLK